MNRKKLFVLLGLIAALGMTGCGNSEKETKETDLAVETVDEDSEEIIPDLEDGEEIILDEDELALEEETESEVPLEPITPSDYLVEDITNYVTLGSLDELTATQYTYEITDEMVQEQIQSELEMYSEETEVDRKADSGDIVYLNLTSAVEDEEPVTETTYVSLGYEEYGAEFDEQIIGASAGETKNFSITFGDDIWLEDWIGKTVTFEAEITSVCELSTPEYNDEFIAEYTDCETMEDYEASVRDLLSSEYEEMSYSDVIDSLYTAAASQSIFAGYPEELFDSCKEELLSLYYAFAGTSDQEAVFEMFGISEEDLDAEVLNSVDRRLLINAICLENNLTLTEEEYMSFVENSADYYGYESAVQYEEDNTREALVWSLYESKAAEFLYDAAEITEKEYTED